MVGYSISTQRIKGSTCSDSELNQAFMQRLYVSVSHA